MNDVCKKQDFIIKKIKQKQKKQEKLPFGILNFVNKKDLSIVNEVFGDFFGSRIKSFADSIDLEHPDLFNVFDGELVSENEDSFSFIAMKLFEIISFTKTIQIPIKLVADIRQILFSHSIFRKIELLINSPEKNQIHVRLISDPNVKKSIRKLKKNQKFKPKIEKDWSDIPNDFDLFIRKNKSLIDSSVENLFFLQKNFSQMGLTSIANGIDYKIKKNILNYYFGFEKIEINLSGLILAKHIGLNNFSNIKSIIDKCILELDTSNYELSFTTYTLDEVYELANEDTKNLIQYLDNFEEINHKSLFDYFRVILVSPKVKQSTECLYYFIDKNGNKFYFKNEDEAQKKLDFYLFQQKCIFGALLGDRDGDHYFVSYFL